MTMLGAPWLVRERGHVHIELVTAALPPRPAPRWSAARGARLRRVSPSWPGRAGAVPDRTIERNDFDVRAYFYPRWLLTIWPSRSRSA
jgi:C4-dicarboxylate transporter DctQ subunit